MGEHLGPWIRKRRKDLDIPAKALAHDLGISKSLLSQYETGKLTPPPSLLPDLARLLDVAGWHLRREWLADRILDLLAQVGLDGSTEGATARRAVDEATQVCAAVLSKLPGDARHRLGITDHGERLLSAIRAYTEVCSMDYGRFVGMLADYLSSRPERATLMATALLADPGMTNTDEIILGDSINALAKVLASASRSGRPKVRSGIVAALAQGPVSLSDLARQFDLTEGAVVRAIEHLRATGLSITRQGEGGLASYQLDTKT